MGDSKFCVFGITGNIGSGKSYVSKLISQIGIPVFDCDSVAKQLYDTNDDLKQIITSRYGSDIYDCGRINKKKLSDIIFSDQRELEFIESSIHPIVKSECISWIDRMREYGHKYALVETAILFESDMYKIVNKTILVDADLDVRIKRAMLRDNATYESVLSRLNKQASHTDLRHKVDFVINNSGKVLILPQMLLIFQNV